MTYQTAFPIIFCSQYPDCSKIQVELPFGLPPFNFDNPCCEGLNVTLDQLEGLLRPMIPFLKLLECGVKLMSIILAIPEAMGPPPDISKIVELIEAVADFTTKCVPYILSLIPVLPTAIIAFCRMVRGLAQLVLTILRCLKKVVVLNVSIAADVLSLNASIDPLLQEAGLCLKGQNDVLQDGIIGKLKSLMSVFSLINMLLEFLFEFIPPLKDALTELGLYPISDNIDFSSGSLPENIIEIIDTLIVVFTAIESASNICAVGS